MTIRELFDGGKEIADFQLKCRQHLEILRMQQPESDFAAISRKKMIHILNALASAQDEILSFIKHINIEKHDQPAS